MGYWLVVSQAFPSFFRLHEEKPSFHIASDKMTRECLDTIYFVISMQDLEPKTLCHVLMMRQALSTPYMEINKEMMVHVIEY